MVSDGSSVARRTAGHWSLYEPDTEKGFFGFPPLRPYLVASAFGAELAESHEDNRWWAEDIVSDLYLRDRNPARMLSLCCGFGAVEQHMVSYVASVELCVAVDIAQGAINEAARRADALGLGKIIRYEIADLNSYDWSAATYDLVVANGALHHLENLEGVLDGVRQCLKPGGVLYANEHIGATHRDFPRRQLELINATAYLIPSELRRSRSLRRNPFTNASLRQLVDGFLGNLDLGGEHPAWSRRKKALARVLRHVSLPARSFFGPLVLSPKPYVMGIDPSEGVSSARILGAINERFDEVHVHPYGGAVLAYALDSAFYEGFRAGNPEHERLLQILCSLEAFLVGSGELPDEHAIIVATRM